jgi:hypothetical protein
MREQGAAAVWAFSGLPIALTGKTTLLSFACGQKKLTTSSRKVNFFVVPRHNMKLSELGGCLSAPATFDGDYMHLWAHHWA